MNSEFKKRQAEVLEILSILAREAEKAGETLVFIGGSAVQTAALKQPRRLSIDLDLYYSGDAETLLSKLVGYKVEKRPVKPQDFFYFYNVVKDSLQVKVDIARFPLVKAGKLFELKKLAISKKYFEAKVATPDYLLASKLATLGIGTIGRSPDKEGFRLDFLKDVFDANCLIEEFGTSADTWKYFGQICQVQNQVRKTNFTVKQVIESAVNSLLGSGPDNNAIKIGKPHLSEFQNAYLQVGTISTKEYWTMAYRLAACLSIVKGIGAGVASASIEKMEKIVAKKYGDRFFVSECEAKLIESGFEQKHLHELKVIAPQALVYLFATKYPLDFDKLNDDNRDLVDGLKKELKRGLKNGL